jgi:NAD(P)-dependent dehydrogenase (short-subunit alcohol dehydrogenase family)
MQLRNLAGKVVVITGASSGFGKGAALRFAKEGASVVVAARRGHLLQSLAHQCQLAGGRALAVTADVSEAEELQRLADAALASFGRIDVWVNNAGVGALGRFERIPLEDHIQVIKTNLIGVIAGSWVAWRQFLKQGSGTLINIASELGGHTVPYYSSYAAAKHGIVGLNDALRQELDAGKVENIHVCTVMPSAHDTPFFDHAANYTGHEIQAPKPLHDPENVIETIVRLAHDPKDKDVVGGDGIAKILLKKVAPGLQEAVMTKFMHRTQMEKAPHASNTAGALQRPIPQGTDVSGHRLAR